MGGLRGHDFGAGAIAGESIPRGDKTVEGFGIQISPLTLGIRSVRAYVVEAPLIPIESEPPEVILDKAGILIFRTLRVEILDTQQPFSATTFDG